MKKWLFSTYWHHISSFQSHLQHTVSFLDKTIKKNDDFHKIFNFFFFIPMIVPMLLLDYDTKKKILTQVPTAENPSQKCQKMPILEPISTIFCHFDGLHSAENLGGIALFFDMFLFKIWKNIKLLWFRLNLIWWICQKVRPIQ